MSPVAAPAQNTPGAQVVGTAGAGGGGGAGRGGGGVVVFGGAAVGLGSTGPGRPERAPALAAPGVPSSASPSTVRAESSRRAGRLGTRARPRVGREGATRAFGDPELSRDAGRSAREVKATSST